MRSLECPVVKAGVCLGHIRGHMVLLRYINDLLDNDMFLHREFNVVISANVTNLYLASDMWQQLQLASA